MSSQNWNSGAVFSDAIISIKPRVVKISTAHGSGTGFFVSSSKDGSLCAIATAAHVVEHPHYWEEPIRILDYEAKETRLLRATDRAIFLEQGIDTAAVVFAPQNMTVPELNLPLTPEGKYLRPGNEIGWLGFPGIAPDVLSFFSGRISGWIQARKSYLVDGVAINGVSGGPAFWAPDPGYLAIVGVVTAYIPNRATGETLPGLCEIRDVAQFQELAKQFKNLDEAKENESAPPANPPPTPGEVPSS
jgi:hypothetical protein